MARLQQLEKELAEAKKAAKPASPVKAPIPEVSVAPVGTVELKSETIATNIVIPGLETPTVPVIPVSAAAISLPTDILPLPSVTAKTEITSSSPNAGLSAMVSSGAGTLPLPVLPNINLPSL
jgi:hypothetical protein